MTIIVWCTVVPPDGATLAERSLHLIDGFMRAFFRRSVVCALCHPNGASRRHERLDEMLPMLWFEGRIRQAPQSASNVLIAAEK